MVNTSVGCVIFFRIRIFLVRNGQVPSQQVSCFLIEFYFLLLKKGSSIGKKILGLAL